MPDNTSPRGFPFPVSSDPVAITADIQALAEAVNDLGFVFSERVIYTTDATWTKADYPGIRAVRVLCVGDGGAGGGAGTTGAGEISISSGGGSAALSRSWILEASLGVTEAVTVGPGGTGLDNNVGNPGSGTQFGSAPLVRANGGHGGSAPGASSGNPLLVDAIGFSSSGINVGDLIVPEADHCGLGIRLSGSVGASGEGLSSPFGYGGMRLLSGSSNGNPGKGFGSGGSAGRCGAGTGTTRAGGSGAPGLIVVDIYV